mmetsp:Transcript_40963/g.105753  ORF Transcript_40963/g.105753 Transcript_40963/m.105753 type:complete len:215 (-) Transcript_40963:64-708(-)
MRIRHGGLTRNRPPELRPIANQERLLHRGSAPTTAAARQSGSNQRRSSGGGKGGGSGGKGGDSRPGDWECPGCGANVFASKDACFKCGERKPAGARGGGSRPQAEQPPISWPPLGFGPRLSPEQFAVWQRTVRSSFVLPDLKGQFEEWQKQTRAATAAPLAAAPPPVGAESALAAPVLHSKESFEAWQRTLRESKASRRSERKKARSRSRSPFR